MSMHVCGPYQMVDVNVYACASSFLSLRMYMYIPHRYASCILYTGSIAVDWPVYSRHWRLYRNTFFDMDGELS